MHDADRRTRKLFVVNCQQPFQNCSVIPAHLPYVCCCCQSRAALKCRGSASKQCAVGSPEASLPKIPGQVQHMYQVAEQVPVPIASAQRCERKVIAQR